MKFFIFCIYYLSAIALQYKSNSMIINVILLNIKIKFEMINDFQIFGFILLISSVYANNIAKLLLVIIYRNIYYFLKYLFWNILNQFKTIHAYKSINIIIGSSSLVF